MNIIKFRIKHYKSISDSNDCYLDPHVTVLAGQNESGKTAVLEALRDFDPVRKKISDEAKKTDATDDKKVPEITVTYSLNNEDINEIEEHLDTALNKELRNYLLNNSISLTRKLGYLHSINSDIHNILSKLGLNKHHDSHTLDIINKEIQSIGEHISELCENEIEFTGHEDTNEFISILNTTITQYLPTFPSNIQNIIKSKLSNITEEINNYEAQDYWKLIRDALLEIIPHFIYFSSFDDILQYETPLGSIVEYPSILDFLKLLNIDIDSIISTESTQTRKNILQGRSAEINSEFVKTWKQETIKLEADVSGENLIIAVKEEGKPYHYTFSQRSKGFQWFVAFYLRLNAERTNNNIILIDEPGLYLHAKAQKDVLDVLEKLSDKTPIVFSTHSPYLIDTDKLHRIRLVSKDSTKGTTISNNAHHGGNQETLTPIITAIGLDITKSLTSFGKKNIVVEGISDYYYLKAFEKYSGKNFDFNVIPSVGATKIPQLLSLLIGFGLDYLAVLDNDKEGKRVYKELTNNELTKDRVIKLSDDSECCIEDFFSSQDFKKYIIKDSTTDMKGMSNSDYLKKGGIDKGKALMAKEFIGNISDITLTKTTLTNFEKLLTRINDHFS